MKRFFTNACVQSFRMHWKGKPMSHAASVGPINHIVQRLLCRYRRIRSESRLSSGSTLRARRIPYAAGFSFGISNFMVYFCKRRTAGQENVDHQWLRGKRHTSFFWMPCRGGGVIWFIYWHAHLWRAGRFNFTTVLISRAKRSCLFTRARIHFKPTMAQ